MMYECLQGRIVRFFTGKGRLIKLVMPMFVRHTKHSFWGHAPNNKKYLLFRAVIVYTVFSHQTFSLLCGIYRHHLNFTLSYPITSCSPIYVLVFLLVPLTPILPIPLMPRFCSRGYVSTPLQPSIPHQYTHYILSC